MPASALAGLQQIERAAEHEIETAATPLTGSITHQRRLLAIAPHDIVRPRCRVDGLDHEPALLGGGHVAERYHRKAHPRGHPVSRAFERLEDMEAGFRRQDAVRTEAGDQEERRLLVFDS